MNTITPATSVPLPPEKKRLNGWELVARIVIILLGLLVGLIIAVSIGLATGWIPVGC